MIDRTAVYHEVDSDLSSAERADKVVGLCVRGDVALARRFLVEDSDADSLLARGVVYYWLARTGREMDYETAKDILSRASRLFTGSGQLNRGLLADIWVGLCYWRQGQSAEALVVLSKAARETTEPLVRYLALLNKSAPQTDARNWREALHTLAELEPMVASQSDHSLKGLFYHQRGLAFRQAFDAQGGDYLRQAFRDYESASECYEAAENNRLEAAILNNLAGLYSSAGDYNRAHVNVDRAISLYSRLGDRSNLAHARDTKAGVLLEEGHFKRARKYADQAIALARHEDEKALLPGFLLTRGKVLVKAEMPSQAMQDFREAARIAEQSGNLEIAANVYLTIIETLTEHLSAEMLVEVYRRAHESAGARWSSCALKIIDRAVGKLPTSLQELKTGSQRRQEADIIRNALERSGGSISRAAALLGKTHGGLAYIIEKRHPELARERRPIVKRRKKNLG